MPEGQRVRTANGEPAHQRRAGRPERSRRLRTPYPGDFTGIPELSYAPIADELPDPGEVVWTWVPYQEDHTQGKDRPVLVVGKDGDWLLGLMLTSQDHDIDREQENSEGRYWVEIGPGPWDRRYRISEARVDRVLRLDAAGVRRIGGRLAEDRFAAVVAGILQHAVG
ncbi:MAG: type II toxin-antitoxin system PemK/MazF family toxin [Propionibacteriaceae bacterium]|jgi:hypothetical protein|nr:type II toxin-antitoxin system PemK/MazF family toxin [Propionibacteriaceae bacterium]